MKLIYRFTIGIISMLAITSVRADDIIRSCSLLEITIINTTHSVCQLISSNVIHGELISPPFSRIVSGDVTHFEIEQSFFYGPEIELQYSCGGQSVRFSSQQNYNFLSCGNITATIISSEGNICTTFAIQDGTGLSPGRIHWVISSGDN